MTATTSGSGRGLTPYTAAQLAARHARAFLEVHELRERAAALNHSDEDYAAVVALYRIRVAALSWALGALTDDLPDAGASAASAVLGDADGGGGSDE